MKIRSYLKALIPEENLNIKSANYPRHFINQTRMSPKAMGDMSGLVVPSVVANRWSPNVDIDYLQRIYDCHDLVHACIELISSTFSLAKLKVKKLNSDNKYVFDPNHPLQRVLDSPNSSMTGYDLRQSYVVHRYLNGTVAFLLLRGHKAISNNPNDVCPDCGELSISSGACGNLLWHYCVGPVTQILPCHPDRLSKQTYNTKYGKKEYFVYEWENSTKMVVHPNNILTDPFYNPGGSFYGTSPTAQVQRWLEIDLGLSKQVGAYLLNNAIPSMILNIKPTDGTMNQDPTTMLEAIKEKWIRDFSMSGDGMSSGSKVKTPAFVHGEMEVHKIQDALKDIVVKPLFYEIQNRICMAYGVPPNFFEFGQDYGAQSTTIQQQEKNFFNRTIAKNLVSFKAKIERYILSTYNDPTLKLEWDLSEMGIASFLEIERKNYVLKTWELGLISRDHAREELGMDPIQNGELGDDLYRINVLGVPQESGQHTDNRLIVRDINNE